MGRSRATDCRSGLLSLVVIAGLVSACEENPAPDDVVNHPRAPEIARIVSAEEALAGAHLPALDPATMVGAEIRQAIGSGPRCDYRYTTAGRPVLALPGSPKQAEAAGVIKLNGNLVILSSVPDGSLEKLGGFALAAGAIRMAVTPDVGDDRQTTEGVRRRAATAIFEVGEELRVGYRGYLDCMSEPPMKSRGP